MRISDWSSDVCSSDLLGGPPTLAALAALRAADFRSWLARRAGRDFKKTSTARALSVVRGFFRRLERSGSAANHAVRVVRSLKLPHSVPKPLRSEDTTAELQSLMRIPYAVFCLKKKTRSHDAISITAPHTHSNLNKHRLT